MTRPGPPAVPWISWRQPIVIAPTVALLGVATYLVQNLLPAPLVMVALGLGLISASLMLAWAADAGEAVFSGGLVLASVALVTVLPEAIIELRFAFIQAAELVTANLTGATRLLLTGAVMLPLVVTTMYARTKTVRPPVKLEEDRRLELGILLASAVFAIQFTVRGNVSVVESMVLLGLYLLYARRIQGIRGEEPAVMGVAAQLRSLPQRLQRPVIAGLIVFAGAVVVLIANPFADALLKTGTALGIDPYYLIQSVVPTAVEFPEFLIVGVLVVNHRPSQALALFLASAVTQWTLGLGLLPIAYMAGGGGPFMPLAPREQQELAFTIAMTLFVVAALLPLSVRRVDAVLVAAVFVLQLLYPTVVVRIGASFVLTVFAIDLLVAHRHSIRPVVRAIWRLRPPRPS